MLVRGHPIYLKTFAEWRQHSITCRQTQGLTYNRIGPIQVSDHQKPNFSFKGEADFLLSNQILHKSAHFRDVI